MNLPGEVPQFDITIKAGADYKLTLQFEADDDSEITNYGTTIYNGTVFLTDNSVIDTEEHAWYPDADEWTIDLTHHALVTNSKWQIEAQLREFAEAESCFDFGVEAGNDGFALVLPREITEQIHYARGCYDVFITDTEGLRDKLLEGTAKIIRNVTR